MASIMIFIWKMIKQRQIEIKKLVKFTLLSARSRIWTLGPLTPSASTVTFQHKLSHLLCPGTLPVISWPLTHLVLLTVLWKSYCYLTFRGEKTEAQEGQR